MLINPIAHCCDAGGLEVNQLVELATAQSRRLDCETVLQEVEREHPGELSRMEHKANAPAGLTFQFIRSLLYVVIDSVVMSFAACNCIYTVQRLMLLGNELTLYTLRKLMSMVKLSLQGQGLLLHLLLVEDLQLWKHYHYQVLYVCNGSILSGSIICKLLVLPKGAAVLDTKNLAQVVLVALLVQALCLFILF